jgi:hypothetical protein
METSRTVSFYLLMDLCSLKVRSSCSSFEDHIILVDTNFLVTPGSLRDKDTVNLKLKPNSETINLRRLHKCHVIPQNLDEEFMVALQRHGPTRTRSVNPLRYLPHELVDTILAMVTVSNRREFQYLVSASFFQCVGYRLQGFEIDSTLCEILVCSVCKLIRCGVRGKFALYVSRYFF